MLSGFGLCDRKKKQVENHQKYTNEDILSPTAQNTLLDLNQSQIESSHMESTMKTSFFQQQDNDRWLSKSKMTMNQEEDRKLTILPNEVNHQINCWITNPNNDQSSGNKRNIEKGHYGKPYAILSPFLRTEEYLKEILGDNVLEDELNMLNDLKDGTLGNSTSNYDKRRMPRNESQPSVDILHSYNDMINNTKKSLLNLPESQYLGGSHEVNTVTLGAQLSHKSYKARKDEENNITQNNQLFQNDNELIAEFRTELRRVSGLLKRVRQVSDLKSNDTSNIHNNDHKIEKGRTDEQRKNGKILLRSPKKTHTRSSNVEKSKLPRIIEISALENDDESNALSSLGASLKGKKMNSPKHSSKKIGTPQKASEEGTECLFTPRSIRHFKSNSHWQPLSPSSIPRNENEDKGKKKSFCKSYGSDVTHNEIIPKLQSKNESIKDVSKHDSPNKYCNQSYGLNEHEKSDGIPKGSKVLSTKEIHKEYNDMIPSFSSQTEIHGNVSNERRDLDEYQSKRGGAQEPIFFSWTHHIDEAQRKGENSCEKSNGKKIEELRDVRIPLSNSKNVNKNDTSNLKTKKSSPSVSILNKTDRILSKLNLSNSQENYDEDVCTDDDNELFDIDDVNNSSFLLTSKMVEPGTFMLNSSCDLVENYLENNESIKNETKKYDDCSPTKARVALPNLSTHISDRNRVIEETKHKHCTSKNEITEERAHAVKFTTTELAENVQINKNKIVDNNSDETDREFMKPKELISLFERIHNHVTVPPDAMPHRLHIISNEKQSMRKSSSKRRSKSTNAIESRRENGKSTGKIERKPFQVFHVIKRVDSSSGSSIFPESSDSDISNMKKRFVEIPKDDLLPPFVTPDGSTQSSKDGFFEKDDRVEEISSYPTHILISPKKKKDFVKSPRQTKAEKHNLSTQRDPPGKVSSGSIHHRRQTRLNHRKSTLETKMNSSLAYAQDVSLDADKIDKDNATTVVISNVSKRFAAAAQNIIKNVKAENQNFDEDIISRMMGDGHDEPKASLKASDIIRMFESRPK